MAILTSVRWYFIVVLTCISFITDDIELLSSTFWQFVFLWLLLLLFSCSNSCADYLQLHGLHHARLLCPSLSRVVWSNSCSLSQWCHPTISSSMAPFSSYPQSFPASGFSPMSRLFESVLELCFNISPSNECSVLISFRIDWFDLLAIRGTLESSPAPHTVSKHQSIFDLQYLCC